MIKSLRILVVDDEQDYCNVMKVILDSKGHETVTCTSGLAALNLLKEEAFHLVITDLIMPEIDGNQLLNEIKSNYPHIEVIMMTAYGSIENAVETMREGAYSYVTKGGNPEELIREINKLQKVLQLEHENKLLKEKINKTDSMLESKNQEYIDMLSIAKKAAKSDTNILILGESGVGKEVIARYIHQNSDRSENQFIDLNCHAIAETVLESELFGHEKGSFTGAQYKRIGRIEAADQGSLFLDEVGDMPSAMQGKLLKTLENKKVTRIGSNEEIEVNFRLIAATNKNLDEEINEGRFREDLYYRISTIVLTIPPLRHRTEDLPLLIDYFFNQSQKEMNKSIKKIEKPVMEFLNHYHYPGNIRELKNIIERLVVLSENGVIVEEALPLYPVHKKDNTITPPVDKTLAEIRREAETKHIENVLREHNYNKTKTAEILGITRRQLFNKITEYEIE
ncbi:MAG: sigma-54-dependent transcriptional regulator [Anaerovoracaceae bacterium]|jgi:two-component system response regulator HydG